jgi:hypothetical protein
VLFTRENSGRTGVEPLVKLEFWDIACGITLVAGLLAWLVSWSLVS